MLQHVLHGLQDPILASEAATALQSICTKCRDQMAQHFTGASNSMAAEVVEKKKFSERNSIAISYELFKT